jgi:transposase
MGKLKTVELTKAQRSALEKGYRAGESHSFRVRCQIILLKCEQRTSAEIAEILGCCEMVVNNWLKRFEMEGMEGLRTKSGRGRKPILDAERIGSESSKQFNEVAKESVWRKWSWKLS